MTTIRRLMNRLSAVVLALGAVFVAAGCTPAALSLPPTPEPSVLPPVTCGGVRPPAPEELTCSRAAEIALATLARQTPDQLARGVDTIDVFLAECPRGEMPPQIDCTDAAFAHLVTVTFGPALAGGPIEESLTVAIEPATGRVLGIANPLVR